MVIITAVWIKNKIFSVCWPPSNCFGQFLQLQKMKRPSSLSTPWKWYIIKPVDSIFTFNCSFFVNLSSLSSILEYFNLQNMLLHLNELKCWHISETFSWENGLFVVFNAVVNLIRSKSYKLMVKCFFLIIANTYTFVRIILYNYVWDVGVFNGHMLKFIKSSDGNLEKL